VADYDENEEEGLSDERPQSRPRGRQGGRRWRRFVPKVRVCAFCVDKNARIDYKQSDVLRRYMNDRGKIRALRQTGTCAKHQRKLAQAVKRARHLALLPFTSQGTRR